MNPKIQFHIEPTETRCSEIYDKISTKYKLNYCGIYSYNEKTFLFVHAKSRMSHNVIRKLLLDIVKVKDSCNYKKVYGGMIDEHGNIPRHGGSKPGKRQPAKKKSPVTITNNNVNNISNVNNSVDNSINNDNRVSVNNFYPVTLNPFGSESIEHITSDDMNSCYDDPDFNGVIINFSDHLFCVKENLNIRCGSKSSICKAFTEDGWVSKHKDEGYQLIYDNLTKKSLEAMEKHRAEIPEEMIAKHENEVAALHQLKIDPREDQPSFIKYRNSSINLIGENISNRIKNFQLKNGKRLKFT